MNKMKQRVNKLIKNEKRQELLKEEFNNISKYKEELSLKSDYYHVNYGISKLEYQKMVHKQENKCAICYNEEMIFDSFNNRIRPLAVDHCHMTGNIRGLLCGRCNMSLGGFKDNIEYLNNAIEYLRKYMNY